MYGSQHLFFELSGSEQFVKPILMDKKFEMIDFNSI